MSHPTCVHTRAHTHTTQDIHTLTPRPRVYTRAHTHTTQDIHTLTPPGYVYKRTHTQHTHTHNTHTQHKTYIQTRSPGGSRGLIFARYFLVYTGGRISPSGRLTPTGYDTPKLLSSGRHTPAHILKRLFCTSAYLLLHGRVTG